MKIYAAYAPNGLNNKGEGPIVVLVRIGRNFKKSINTGITIKPSQWNKRKNEIRNTALQDYVDNQINKIKMWRREQYEKRLEITPESFKAWYDGKPADNNFNEFYSDVLEKDMTLVRSSYNDQSQTLKILNEFKQDIRFDDLDRRFVDDWNNYLIEQGYSQNTVKKHHKNLKKYINKAIDYGKLSVPMDKHPYRGFIAHAKPSERVFLTPDELDKLVATKLTGRDAEVRDLFLFACATGMRFIDTQEAKIEMNEEELTYTPIKTQKHTGAVKIPLSIVNEKWATLPRTKITNPEANRILKNIMIAAEINKLLTFHVARHTFLTHVAKNTGSIFQVMKYGGLRKTDTAMIYVHLAGV